VYQLSFTVFPVYSKVRSLMSKHKLMKKREHVDKELSRSNTLLSKYDTTRVLALKAVSGVVVLLTTQGLMLLCYV
jgi:hypothetical protein